jgi:hypothetical protein
MSSDPARMNCELSSTRQKAYNLLTAMVSLCYIRTNEDRTRLKYYLHSYMLNGQLPHTQN